MQPAHCHGDAHRDEEAAAHQVDHPVVLFDEGEEIPAHEFHYWECTETGSDFTAAKPSGKQWECGYASDHLYAGFPHFHFYAKPTAAVRFYEACLRYKEKQNG